MNNIYKKNESAIARDEEGELLLFEHGEDGNAKISLLNKTAYAIWELCDGTNSVEDIINAFSTKFATKNRSDLEVDIHGFIDRMVKRGWLI